MDLNRRQILCGLGGIACGAACAGLINPKEDAHAASEKMQRFQQAGGDFGWKPHKLDVEAVQKVAYEKPTTTRATPAATACSTPLSALLPNSTALRTISSPSPCWKCSKAAFLTGAPSAAASAARLPPTPSSGAARNVTHGGRTLPLVLHHEPPALQSR